MAFGGVVQAPVISAEFKVTQGDFDPAPPLSTSLAAGRVQICTGPPVTEQAGGSVNTRLSAVKRGWLVIEGSLRMSKGLDIPVWNRPETFSREGALPPFFRFS